MAAFTDNTTDSPTTIGGESGLTPAEITGIVSTCIAAVVALVGVWGFLENRRRNRREDQTQLQEVGQQPTEGTQDRKQARAAARKAKEALKERYKTTGSYVQMLPWVDDNKRHIMDIYTKLRLVEQVDTRGKNQKEDKNMGSYEEMFKTREGNPIKRVVISGSAGIGKTTLFDKIAYDWQLGNSETLNKYELVFVLKMHSLKQSSNLMDAIVEQLLGKNSVDHFALEEFIDKNQDKVLILLDGFDEFQTTKLDKSSFGSILNILNRNQRTECWVVITTRSPLDKLVNSSLVEKPYTHVTVQGFSNTDVKEYVNKFLPRNYYKARNLIEKIQLSDTLSDLAKSLMLLLLMCLLWDAENTLPDTMTRLYKYALKFIFKRKERDIKEDEISKILIAIGEVALDALISTNESFAFREEDFERSALNAALDAGVLTSEGVIDGLDNYQRVSFIHHTFLEYCAAMYWRSQLNTDKFNTILDQTDVELTETSTLAHPHSSRLSRYDYLFRFCCGDNEACTHRILQKLCQDTDSRHAIICYFESQSKELPPKEVVSSVLTGDIYNLYWDNDCTNAFFYFLKSVTALTRGNEYFRAVRTLSMARFNFQRFGDDLAEAIKLMTSLQSLSVIKSSLTIANTQQILSSLASPSTLAELDLSLNDALGGSVSLLKDQLGKLQSLNKLHLVQCSLVAQDVSPIAESMGDTLVDLDVSSNPALGGCAFIWGPELGKMECLQNINLAACLLKGTDIEPITEALSGVTTLNLSWNPCLGGCAKFWALQLKSLIYLEELTLGVCLLSDDDVQLIAESVSETTILNLWDDKA